MTGVHNHGDLDITRRRPTAYVIVVVAAVMSVSSASSQATADTAAQRALPLADRPSAGWDEYCETQQFSPTCAPEHVIVVTEAWYGRQQIGKCVKVDYGYVGCFADVLNHLDGACSGRRSCTVSIPDASLDLSNTCPREFKTYLNASYICVEVEKAACQSCSWSKTARLTARRGYISSMVTTEENNCGTIHCPWSIEVKTGQKINITLYDFAETKATSTETVFNKQACYRYGVIREKTAAQDTVICSGHGRESRIYTSLSNSVEIQLVNPEVFGRIGHFLLHYEVLGCPDYPKPDNMWMKREDSRIQLGCMSSNDQWQLVCKDIQWEGQIGTCPQDHKTDDPNKATGPPATVTLGIGLLTAIVLGIALVVGVLILTVGIVCLKRQQQSQRWRAAPQQYYYPPAGGHQFYYDYPEPLTPELLEMHRRHKAQMHAAAAAAASAAASGGTDASGQRIYLPVAGGPPVTLHNSQRQNIYLRHMDSRPLPSIPSLTEESTSDDDVIRTQAIVHRANSSTRCGNGGVETPYNRSLCSNPLSTSSQGSRTGDPQYFVLDGQQQQQQQQQQGTVGEDCGASASAATSPVRRDGQGQGQGKGGSANGSCSEIQLRPSRDGGPNGSGGGDNNSSSWT